jgi:beta-lactamase class D
MKKNINLKNFLLLLFIFLNDASASAATGVDSKTYFPNMDGCFLLYNMRTSQFEKVIGENRCRERFLPCSTFKVALAVMAFDSGILKDENQVIKWNGKKDSREVANHDQNAKTWMKNSIVWVSQGLTPLIGEKRLEGYLQAFHYGNQDISAGITQAWLVQPDAKGPALRISAYEQAEFMRALWSGKLKVLPQTVQMAKDITYLEISPKGFRLNGKTGSNYYSDNAKKRLGWFIAHIENGDKEYVAVTNFSDLAPNIENSYGGVRAKEITKKILNDSGLW